ncbi:MAG: hypothetical protein J3K34DRAFT_506248 [Monoraphidium minutum]|nr:MAG: hypothetical protein J3K34DRAFT_506248 [Monoraphidium minutum]
MDSEVEGATSEEWEVEELETDSPSGVPPPAAAAPGGGGGGAMEAAPPAEREYSLLSDRLEAALGAADCVARPAAAAEPPASWAAPPAAAAAEGTAAPGGRAAGAGRGGSGEEESVGRRASSTVPSEGSFEDGRAQHEWTRPAAPQRAPSGRLAGGGFGDGMVGDEAAGFEEYEIEHEEEAEAAAAAAAAPPRQQQIGALLRPREEQEQQQQQQRERELSRRSSSLPPSPAHSSPRSSCSSGSSHHLGGPTAGAGAAQPAAAAAPPRSRRHSSDSEAASGGAAGGSRGTSCSGSSLGRPASRGGGSRGASREASVGGGAAAWGGGLAGGAAAGSWTPAAGRGGGDPHGGHPASAGRAAAAAMEAPPVEAVAPQHWDVREVCEWVSALGLEQYRGRFLHHMVDGRLALRLGDGQLKSELGIGPLGHRGDGKGKRPRSAPSLRDRPPAAGGAGAGAAALGPAAGRVTVQEQRAKLVFELGRAQARAAHQSAAARRSGDVAALADREVAQLGAAIRDLDRRYNVQLEHATGALDSKARVPWQHVGPGTRAADPHPERHGRPWDGPEVDETFSPKISDLSRRIMSGPSGSGGAPSAFLERLEAAARARRRQQQQQRQQRAGGGAGGGGGGGLLGVYPDLDAAAAKKRAAADAALVARAAARWGVGLPEGGDLSEALTSGPRRGNDLGCDPGSDLAEAALDEVVEGYWRELMLSERRRRALLAARGRAKVAGVAAAVRTMEFMERYRSDLRTRDGRLAELQERFFASAAPGRTPAAAESRDATSADAWFARLGWDSAGAGGALPFLFAAMLGGACGEWDKQRDRERDWPAGAKTAGPPAFDWARAPWSADGLGPLMESELARQRDAAAATETGGGGGAAAKGAAAAAPAEGGAAGGKGPRDWLGESVKLLAGLPAESLGRLRGGRKVAVYRALRSQRFLEATEADLRAREAKALETYRRLTAKTGKARARAYRGARGGWGWGWGGRAIVSRGEMDAFFERLQEDGRRRIEGLEKARADRDVQEAKALAAAREEAARFTARRPRAVDAVPAPSRPRPASAPPARRK